MTEILVLFFAFVIGAVAGLRSMTAPAAVAWAAHLHWIVIAGSPFAFMGSRWAVAIFTFGAVGEYVADLLPFVPSRISAFPLMARLLIGFLTGSCIGVAGGLSFWLGGCVGIAGALVGAFGGYYARKGLVQSLGLADAWIAVPEDAVAIGLAAMVVTRFR